MDEASRGYAARAEEHWRRFRPAAYAQIPTQDRQDFFLDLAMQARTQIAELARSLAGPDLPGESGLDKLGRLNNARQMAEEQVLQELILTDPETSEPPDQDQEKGPSQGSPGEVA